jgi:prefoldin alpha subunit
MPEIASRQEALVVLESYQRQLDAAGRQIDFLQGVYDDTMRAKKGLEGIGEEKSSEILLPMGAQTFVRGTVSDKQKVITSIGAGYATERPREDAIKRLEARAESVQKELERLMQGAVELQQEAARLQEMLEDAPEAE